MLRLRPFELARPTSLEEAASLLQSRDAAMLLAGGTDLVPKLKRAQFAPRLVVSLERIDALREIRTDADALLLGGQTTLRRLEHAAELADFPALRQAIASVATPILRNRATLAGNLLQDTRCHYVDRSSSWREGVNDCLKLGSDGCRVAKGADRCFATLCSDVAPMLAVLDAEALLLGEGGTRRQVAVEDLYRDDGIENLRFQGEILTAIRLPRRPEHAAYRKLRMRGSFDFPELGLAVRAVAGGDQLELAAAASAVAPMLQVIKSHIAASELSRWSDEFCATVKPVDTGFFPPDYRKLVLENFLAQALDELLPHR